ncbi:MAG: ATP-binding cassette domain-containing protein [Defluviitaleaceae bacterium]|nr:ATP-binding cassette domain-containing protein [Defluviitaleaceae bacterium]
MIKLENVSKVFATGEKALDDVSLNIEKGDIFGIVGRSGAGKSTMLKIIGLLEQPTSGTICMLGSDVSNVKGSQANVIKRNIGTVFQGYNLLMQRSVAKNIAFPMELRRNPRYTKQEMGRRCAELAELVGLGDKLNAYPASLSGGQMQRVAIARALATEPQILLCDEPTSALDTCTSKEILGLLRDINAKLGMTIVIITHDMQVIKAICTRTVVLDIGRVAEMGNTAQVLENPKHPATQLLLDFNV